MMLAVIRQRLREGAGRRATSCWPSSPTRRPAASGARAGWWTTTPSCSRGSPRRSARSAGSAPRSAAPRLYLIQTAEKGIAWMRLTARGTAGHGSMLQPDNAVTELGRGGGQDRAPRVAGPADPGRAGVPRRGLPTALGVELDPRGLSRPRRPSSARSREMAGATVSNTANPTMLSAGYKVNVVPAGGDRAGGRQVPARRRGRFLRRGGQAARPGRPAGVRPQRHRRGDHLRRAR